MRSRQLEAREKNEARDGDTRISLVAETKTVLEYMGQLIALLLGLIRVTLDLFKIMAHL